MISISRTRMLEEIKTDNNCIVKAFENNPISILEEDTSKIIINNEEGVEKVNKEERR